MKTSKSFRLLLLLATISASSNLARASEIVTHRLDSESLAGNLIGQRSSNLVTQVYLPDGYHESDEHYPVVYWFGGWGTPGTNPMDGISRRSLDRAIEAGHIPPSIVVSMPVDAATFDHSLYLSSNAFGDWEGFATSEVIPFIDETYRTIAAPEKRAVAGFSVGGFTALMLPILHPDTWGAVGAIDPSSWIIGSAVRDVEEWPQVDIVQPDDIHQALSQMPSNLSGFRGTRSEFQFQVKQVFGQVGARISPNGDSPTQADFPIDLNGEWSPDVREDWRQFDLGDPDMIGQQLGVLQDLATVSIVIPDDEARSAALWNRELVDTLQSAGVHAKGIGWGGDHNTDLNGRFIAMLEDVLGSLVTDVVGDLSFNGQLDVADLNILFRDIANRQRNRRLDLNMDRRVDVNDAYYWVTELKSTFVGDANLDGEVKFDDFLALSANFGEVGGWAEGDFDANGQVEFPDFLALSANFGNVAAANASAAAAPEPTAQSIALFGLLSLIGFRKRR